MQKMWFGLFAGILALLSLPARAQDAETIADVRCLIIGTGMAANADTNMRTVGTMVSLYYIGRLDGRVPTLALKELLVKELGAMTAADISSEATRCGTALKNRGDELTRMGQEISAQGKPTTDVPAAPAK